MAVFFAAVLLTSPVFACGKYGQRFDHRIGVALNGSAAQADRAVQQLRDFGPTALHELIEYRGTLLETISENGEADFADDLRKELTRLEDVIDRVGGQKYCSASKLYWYTDLEQAQAVAKASGKPILSLRLLGQLTDEFSCANSRFFRTTLYANSTISNKLRDQFVLHWKMVRPVPKVTIDFGDGRKLERTLTGNSIHYILDSTGQTIDALPGLYGPAAFIERLDAAREAWRLYAQAGESDRQAILDAYHVYRLSEIQSHWSTDLERAKRTLNASPVTDKTPPQLAEAGAAPPAEIATGIAQPKARVEIPILAAITMNLARLESDTDEQLWNVMANLHREEVTLDNASIALIQRQNPNAFQAGQLAITKRVVENPILRLVRSLQSSIAVDTVRNEFQLHRRIHEWFVSDNGRPTDVEQLNERVYAELFLTPGSDPWLGLVSDDTYTALENNGIVLAEAPEERLKNNFRVEN
jgi:hypothetical protein